MMYVNFVPKNIWLQIVKEEMITQVFIDSGVVIPTNIMFSFVSVCMFRFLVSLHLIIFIFYLTVTINLFLESFDYFGYKSPFISYKKGVLLFYKNNSSYYFLQK